MKLKSLWYGWKKIASKILENSVLSRIEIWIAQYPKTVLTIVLLSGLLLRLYGIDFGLPYLYEPDEHVHVNIAGRIVADHDLNPHWFGHPATTTIYMMSGLYAFIFRVGLSLGVFASPGDFTTFFFQNPTVIYLSGRVMIAVFGVASVLLTYLMARRLFNRSTGLLAATFLALSPLHVYFSKVIHPDVQMSFFILVAFWFCLDILQRRTWSSYLLAGFFTGLGTATKYPAVIVATTIVLAHILSGPWQWSRLSKLLVSGVASLVGAFMASPFLFLNFGTTLSNVGYEVNTRLLWGEGEGLIRNLAWYLQSPLLEAVSRVGCILGGVGVVLCVVSRERDKWLLITFPVFFLLFIASLNHRWRHFIIPAIPFLCMLVAHALYWIAKRVGQYWDPRIARWAGFILLLGIVAPMLRTAILQGRVMSLPDTRTLARERIMENIPAGSRVLFEAHTPQLLEELYKYFVVWDGQLVEVGANKLNRGGFLNRAYDKKNVEGAIFLPYGEIGRLKDTEAIHREKVEYMVLSSSQYDRYLVESRRFADYAGIVATYETLMNMGTKIYELKPIPDKTIGPTIRLYRFDRKE